MAALSKFFALAWKAWTKMKERRRVRTEAQHATQGKRGYFVFIVSTCWPTCGHLYPRPRPCVILSPLFFFLFLHRGTRNHLNGSFSLIYCQEHRLNIEQPFCAGHWMFSVLLRHFKANRATGELLGIRCIWIENLINVKIKCVDFDVWAESFDLIEIVLYLN